MAFVIINVRRYRTTDRRLYNRLTEQINLHTFSLHECEEYVQAKGLALNREQILQYYMIFGGISINRLFYVISF